MNDRISVVWAKRGAFIAFCVSLVSVVLLAWRWWVPPVTGDDIMAAGYLYTLLGLPVSLVLPGDFTSRGVYYDLVALVLLSIQWVILGTLIGWLLGWIMKAKRSSSREAVSR